MGVSNVQFLPVSRLEHDGRASLRSSGNGDGANPEATLGHRLRYVGSDVLGPIEATIRGLPAFPLRWSTTRASGSVPLKLGLDFFLLGQHHMQARGGTYRETKKHKSLRLAVTRSGGSD